VTRLLTGIVCAAIVVVCIVGWIPLSTTDAGVGRVSSRLDVSGTVCMLLSQAYTVVIKYDEIHTHAHLRGKLLESKARAFPRR
jgi:hypothetical protein